MTLLKTMLLVGAVAGMSACAQPLMTWMPLAGAVGLVYKATHPAHPAAVAPAGTTRTTLAEFERLHEEGTVLVVDVRTTASFTAGHIPGAMNVPVDEMSRRAAEVLTRAGAQPIVTYCSCVNEHASTVAAQVLLEAGACRVSALVGGYPAWTAGGRPVERGDGPR
jgi:rhodanese-related sulfurtransferase